MNHYSIEICDIETCYFPPNVKLRRILGAEIEPFADKVDIIKKGCIGHCAPFIVVRDSDGDRYLYSNVTEESAKQIIWEHIANDTPVEGWAVKLSS